LCKPFGIDVVVDLGVNLGAPFTASIDEGQSIFSFLDELCRYRGIRLLGDEQGRLVLTKPGAQKSTSKLELGVNIKAARASFSVRNVFSAYTVLAQLTDPTGLFSANAVARQKGREVEALLSRHRPFVSVSDQQANNKECLKRAQFEQRTRSGRAQGVTYTVVGWRDDQDQLWRKNTLLPIYDPYMGIDGEWLITSVRYILGAQGKQAELTVMPLSAFDIQIPVEKRPINFFKKLDN
jgi:prophage tail gpP-like protein